MVNIVLTPIDFIVFKIKQFLFILLYSSHFKRGGAAGGGVEIRFFLTTPPFGHPSFLRRGVLTTPPFGHPS
jgi:hypothetical protein